MSCTWTELGHGAAWCRACGTLRQGKWHDVEYRDEEGKEIKRTSTGFYHPYGGWQEGPVPSEFQVDVYGEPYTYHVPTSGQQCAGSAS